MRKFGVTLALFTLVASAFAGNLRSEIEAMNKKVLACLTRMDVAGFEKIVRAGSTKDFKYVENGRTLTLDQMIEQMRMGMTQMKKITKAEVKLLSLKESGNTATAVVYHAMTGTMMMPDKKEHKMTFSGKSTDVYKKVNGTWKMASMTWGKQEMLMDGKPFDPSKMGG